MMKKIHYLIGLPRSGSTLLMNILQQHPDLFTSSTCPTPYLVDACKTQATSVSEFLSLDQDVLTNSLSRFIEHGINGWFEALTNKPQVISKSRSWDTHLNILFSIYKNPKFIVNIRDLRDIICSFEKLSHKYPLWTIGSKEDPVHLMPFEKRMEIYCTDVGANLGRPLYFLPHIVEWMRKKPDNFFLVRFEDLNSDPIRMLQAITSWLELPNFDYDVNNIQQSEQYEHDTVYRALVSHKTENKLRYLEPSWPKKMTLEQSDLVINNNIWYYKTFYPDLVKVTR